jgi:hypothetical protein
MAMLCLYIRESNVKTAMSSLSNSKKRRRSCRHFHHISKNNNKNNNNRNKTDTKTQAIREIQSDTTCIILSNSKHAR